MKWLPTLFKTLPIARQDENEVTIREEQTKALASISQSLGALSNFISGGGLSSLLNGYAKSQAVKEILGGLAAHDGRNALDARVLTQNALEITTQIEKVFDKYHETLKAKASGEVRDSHIHDAEAAYLKWKVKES